MEIKGGEDLVEEVYEFHGIVRPHKSTFIEHVVAPPPIKKEQRICKAKLPDFPPGSTSFDEDGNQYFYVDEKTWRQYVAHTEKERGRQVFYEENGVAVVTDKRVKPGDSIELQLGILIVHPDHQGEMEARISSRNIKLRSLSEKERERLTCKARVKIDTEIRLAKAQQKSKKRIAR